MNIDLNADMGESFGNYTIGNDDELMKWVSSANIACGFHAGDPIVMKRTVISALRNNVAIGAHPGYPDIQGFGRRAMDIKRDEIISMVTYQVGALRAIVESEGGRLHHVKAHGALYNSATGNQDLADAIVTAIKNIDPSLIVFGLPSSCLEAAANKQGLVFGAEAFADRAYNNDGTLVSRDFKGAVIHDKKVCLERVLGMIKSGSVVSITGEVVSLNPETICLHGDNRDALDMAETLHKGLLSEGVNIISLKRDYD